MPLRLPLCLLVWFSCPASHLAERLPVSQLVWCSEDIGIESWTYIAIRKQIGSKNQMGSVMRYLIRERSIANSSDIISRNERHFTIPSSGYNFVVVADCVQILCLWKILCSVLAVWLLHSNFRNTHEPSRSQYSILYIKQRNVCWDFRHHRPITYIHQTCAQ